MPKWEQQPPAPERKYTEDEIRAALSPEDQAEYDRAYQATLRIPQGETTPEGMEYSPSSEDSKPLNDFAAIRRKGLETLRNQEAQ